MKISPREELGQLHATFVAGGLRALAGIIKRVFGDRSPEEHEKWDESTRQRTQDRMIDALAHGVHTPPKEEVEIPPSDLREVTELPPIDCGEHPDTEDIRALEAADGVERDGRRVIVSDPQRLLSACTALGASPMTWEAFCQQIGETSLYRRLPQKSSDRKTRAILRRKHRSYVTKMAPVHVPREF